MSTFYKLVRSSDNMIIDAGSAEKMRKAQKKSTEKTYIAITSQKVGETFVNKSIRRNSFMHS